MWGGVGGGGDGEGGEGGGLRDGFRVGGCGEQQGGGGVAQVVEPDGGQGGEVGDLLEHVGDGGGVQRGAVGVGELGPRVGPGVPGVFLFFLLPLAGGAEGADGVGGAGRPPFPRGQVRGGLAGPPGQLADPPQGRG